MIDCREKDESLSFDIQDAIKITLTNEKVELEYVENINVSKSKEVSHKDTVTYLYCRCVRRAKLLHDYLQITANIINNYLLEDFIKLPQLTLNKAQLVASYLEPLYHQLDELLIDALDKYFEHHKDFNDIKEDNKGKKAYQNFLDKFIQNDISIIEVLKEFFKNHKKLSDSPKLNLQENFKLFSELHQKNIKQLLVRFSCQWQNLHRGFLEQTKELIVLEECVNLGNDRHNGGQQAWMFVFQINNTCSRIIYKPFSQESSALLIGDCEKLGKFDKRFEGVQSLLQCINAGLKSEMPLPTLFILPCRDEDNKDSSIANQYGFVEFVSHSPTKELNIYNLAKKAFSESKSDMQRHNFCKNKIREYYQQLMLEAVKDEKCDFIARSEDEINRYSEDCGIIFALMEIAGIRDIHRENLIIHQLRPMLIDVDICFQANNLNNLCYFSFNNKKGAFNSQSISSVQAKLLHSVSSSELETFSMYEKNRLYSYGVSSSGKSNNRVYAVQPDNKIFMESYKKVLDLLHTKPKFLRSWFENVQKINPLVRYLPFMTSEFLTQKGIFETIGETNFKEYYQNKINLSGNFNEDPEPSENINNNIFNDEPIQYLTEEFQKDSIPIFFKRVNDCKLFCGNGTEVKRRKKEISTHVISENQENFLCKNENTDSMKSHKIDIQEISPNIENNQKEDDFFVTSPLQTISEYVEQLIDDSTPNIRVVNQEFIEAFESQASIDLDKLESIEITLIVNPSNVRGTIFNQDKTTHSSSSNNNSTTNSSYCIIN